MKYWSEFRVTLFNGPAGIFTVLAHTHCCHNVCFWWQEETVLAINLYKVTLHFLLSLKQLMPSRKSSSGYITVEHLTVKEPHIWLLDIKKQLKESEYQTYMCRTATEFQWMDNNVPTHCMVYKSSCVCCYLRRAGYVFSVVCLFFCQQDYAKLLKPFSWKLLEGIWAKEEPINLLEQIWVKEWIQDFFPTFFFLTSTKRFFSNSVCFHCHQVA